MLNGEIMKRYSLTKDWRSAGFYETENHRQIACAVRAGLGSGRLIAINRSDWGPDARGGAGAVTWMVRSHELGSSLSNVSPSHII